MGARASRGFTSRTPTVLFVGDPVDAGLRSALAKAFTRSRFCRDPPGPEIGSSDLAVGLFTDADDRSLLAFARWAHATGALALFVELGEHEFLIGPLTRPGKSWLRMVRLRTKGSSIRGRLVDPTRVSTG